VKTCSDKVPEVHFELSDFCFEMTSSSDFTTPDFGIPDSRLSIPLLSTRRFLFSKPLLDLKILWAYTGRQIHSASHGAGANGSSPNCPDIGKEVLAMQNEAPPDESSPLSSGAIPSGKAGLLTSVRL
jgi:hypothetical protein